MNTNIRSKRSDEVWLAAYLSGLNSGEVPSNCAVYADMTIDFWAARFADEETLADIDANKARREIGNIP